MSLLAATAIAGGALNLTKGIIGAFQQGKANRQINRLMANPVVYKRPEEYEQELEQRRIAAAQQRLPGQGYIEQNIGGATAQALSAAERGAISSNVYNRSVGDIYQKQLDAFQNLGLQAAQYQDQMKERYLSTLQRGAGYSDTEWQQNKLSPWEIKMNIATGNRQAGANNMWSGFEGAVGNIQDYLGTKYYQDMLRGSMGLGWGNNTGKVAVNPNQKFSKPLSTAMPTPFTGLTPGLKVNWSNPDNYTSRLD